MRINCPYCGERDSAEFAYGGDASQPRPAESELAVERWAEYVFSRKNPRGWHQEYWQHVHGCRAWLCVTRNTATHEIADVVLPHER